MTNIERERIEKLVSQSLNLREVWLRERQLGLTEQIAANENIKKQWELSDPVEIIQRQTAPQKKRKD